MKEHYTLATVSKKELVNAFDLTQEEAALIHKYRRKLPAIIDAEGDEGFCVDMRELHGQLKVKTPFDKWIKRRLKALNLARDTLGQNCLALENNDLGDYIKIHEQTDNGRQGKVDYMLTVDAAKQVAMMEGGEVGQTVRRYFILCEKLIYRMAKRNPVRQSCKDSTGSLFSNIVSRVPQGRQAKVMAEMHAIVCTVATGQRPSLWKKMIGVNNVRDFLKLNATNQELKRYDEVLSMTEMLSRDAMHTKSSIRKQLEQSFGESDIYCKYLAQSGVKDFDS